MKVKQQPTAHNLDASFYIHFQFRCIVLNKQAYSLVDIIKVLQEINIYLNDDIYQISYLDFKLKVTHENVHMLDRNFQNGLFWNIFYFSELDFFSPLTGVCVLFCVYVLFTHLSEGVISLLFIGCASVIKFTLLITIANAIYIMQRLRLLL